MDGFAHLHVASGFSMRYGASMPEDLVARAADLGQGALALTDRDGLYGAVRFAAACGQAGVDPVLGVDLAVEEPTGTAPPARVRTPVRGGAVVDPRRPRVTVLARGRAGGAGPGVGWAALCRLVTATHLRGERGVPVTTPGLLAHWADPASSPSASGSRCHCTDSDATSPRTAGECEGSRCSRAVSRAPSPRPGGDDGGPAR
ncbi:MAG TPA: PHP domain-containing protein, partial [Phycicoccus sp.]